MMIQKYNYETRNKIESDFRNKIKSNISNLSTNIRDIALEVLEIDSYNGGKTPIINKIISDFKSSKYNKPSEIFTGEYKMLIDVFVPEIWRKSYLHIIDKLNQFQYTTGWNRRSVRTTDYTPQLNKVFSLLKKFSDMSIFNCTLNQYLHDDMSEEMLDFKRNFNVSYDCMIAAELDFGNTEICNTIEDIFMGENNIATVTSDIIRGIIKSNNQKSHKILKDFFLAAKLQEGVRQAVCENSDCGTTDAFFTIFEAIMDNSLIRYASVKRAVATWIGICDESNIDRITEKMVSLMSKCLHDSDFCNSCLGSNDSIELSVALWSKGFYDVSNAINAMEQILNTGTKNQKMTVSYYNLNFDWKGYADVVAEKVFEQYHDDLELIACYMPTYMIGFSAIVNRAIYGAASYNYYELPKTREVTKLPVTELFRDEEHALKHYEILWNIYHSMHKKEIVYSPCIFPWYSVTLSKSDIVKRICLIAFLLDDNDKIDEACKLIPDIGLGNYTTGRSSFIKLLLSKPATRTQIDMVISLLSDKESNSRSHAFQIVEPISLTDKNYLTLEGMLKYKSSDIRTNVLKLLKKQNDVSLKDCVQRLLASSKEELRTGALDILLQLSKDNKRSKCYENLKSLVPQIKSPTTKEKIMIEEICGNSDADEVLNTEGYGLYKLNVKVKLPNMNVDKNILKNVFTLNESQLYSILQKLDDLIENNKTLEYKDSYGNELLLGNSLSVIAYDHNLESIKRWPFSELWIKFYEEHIKDFETLLQLKLYLDAKNEPEFFAENQNDLKSVFGKVLFKLLPSPLKYKNHINCIIFSTYSTYIDSDKLFELSKIITYRLSEGLNSNNLYCKYQENWYRGMREKVNTYIYHPQIALFFQSISRWNNDASFKEWFTIAYRISECYKTDEKINRYSNINILGILDFIKAYTLDMISMDSVYAAAFESLSLKTVLTSLSFCISDSLTLAETQKLNRFANLCLENNSNIEELCKTVPILSVSKDMYLNIVDRILEVELKRGDSSTVFSCYVHSIKRIFGVDRLVQIISALGNETLERSSYYSYGWNNKEVSKKSSLSHLLSICHPNKDDNAQTLRELLKDTDIKQRRIVEVAMYAPQWIDIIEDYLGWSGLKSGCYYFMAHMNDYFDDKKTAIIAKYTPISIEELHQGAFDINWFKDAYECLGEEHFNILYDSAKYISDGSKHSRARKYSDAVTKKLDIREVQIEIDNKRNKDLLMSYTLIPLRNNDRDLLDRYQYLQKFLKESKQFGAQRRASESLAVNVSMSNLATNAGFADVTRLTLNMETMLIDELKHYFNWYEIEDISVSIYVDKSGKSEIQYKKNDKMLKSLPAKFKKNEYIEEIKTVHKKLKEQYSRTKKMFEQSMEDSVEFYVSELNPLNNNPVVKPLIHDLLFVCEQGIGWLYGDVLTDHLGHETKLSGDTKVKIAHPFDIYKDGHWHEYQALLFKNQTKQPFKQVFRELYVKTDEELDKFNSLRYAGNQIQPHKTVGCLKSRRWIADYEDGLQKIYYKENIVARIYAMADWFSPSDIEAPTLEWVEFSDRKTFKSIKISDIPDIIFSEVMRDVDLAVSVAHAGGVDPETSHSTVEMRRAIIEFNLPLFKLANVTFEGSHAIIDGKRSRYSIHLGSGIIHQIGGSQINVLPVHSQSRGKLFLPFVDEDPKTAEIMSKVVLFAEDTKIKDPYILNQIL